MPTRTVSYSEIDAARQCLKKHQFGYKERWVPPVEGRALVRGKLWHNVMEDHYRAIKTWQDAGDTEYHKWRIEAERDRLIKNWLNDPDNEEHELVEWMLDGYLEMYGWDTAWRVMAVEHAPEVWLPTTTGSRSSFKLKLKIDLIVRDSFGRLWIIDHKSGKDLPKPFDLDMEDQFGLYAWALRVLGKPVHGMIYNAARTQRNKGAQSLDSRMARHLMVRTDRELDEIAIDAYKTAKLAYSVKGDAPRSPGPHCGWRCGYTEPCLTSRKGRSAVDMLEDLGFSQNFDRH